MSKQEQSPTEVASTGPLGGGTDFHHPAFGCINVVRWSSSKGNRLYGSDMGHSGGLTIKISGSSMRRDNSRDWHMEQETITEFDMSESQWARFVASVGNGSGVPVTLSCYREGKLIVAPAIAAPDLSRKELHGEEIRQEVAKVIHDLKAEVQRLSELIESGKTSKKELRDVHHEMKCKIENLPSNLGYAMDSFVRAADKVSDEAKTEIECYVNGMATRLGMEQLRGMGSLLVGRDSSSSSVVHDDTDISDVAKVQGVVDTTSAVIE